MLWLDRRATPACWLAGTINRFARPKEVTTRAAGAQGWPLSQTATLPNKSEGNKQGSLKSFLWVVSPNAKHSEDARAPTARAVCTRACSNCEGACASARAHHLHQASSVAQADHRTGGSKPRRSGLVTTVHPSVHSCAAVSYTHLTLPTILLV